MTLCNIKYIIAKEKKYQKRLIFSMMALRLNLYKIAPRHVARSNWDLRSDFILSHRNFWLLNFEFWLLIFDFFIVILSEAKNPSASWHEILHCVQDDKKGRWHGILRASPSGWQKVSFRVLSCGFELWLLSFDLLFIFWLLNFEFWIYFGAPGRSRTHISPLGRDCSLHWATGANILRI